MSQVKGQNSFTEYGKLCIKMISKWGLDEYYDPYSGYCNIPVKVFNRSTDLQNRVKGLLKEDEFKNSINNDYDRWVLTLFTDDGVDFVSLCTACIN